MESIVGQVFMLYLIMPILAVLLGGVMIFIAKKNNLLKDKKSIFYILLTIVILVLPALLGFVTYWFMPYIYIGLAVLYLFSGWYNLVLLPKFVSDIGEIKSTWPIFLFQLCFLLIAGALFSLVFNLCNDLQYGWWASSCMLTFLLPFLFNQMYVAYLHIPIEIYGVWQYTLGTLEPGESFYDDKNQIVVEIELFKKLDSSEPFNIKGKASELVAFGIWFKVFIDDYNFKSPNSTISAGDYGNTYGWVFYHLNWFGKRNYIDPKLNFKENKIKEKYTIIAKRVSHTDYKEEGN